MNFQVTLRNASKLGVVLTALATLTLAGCFGGGGSSSSTPSSATSSSATTQSNINLSVLKVSSGALQPSFNANTLAYSMNVPYSTSNVKITGIAADSNATVTYAPGQSSSINVGTNTLTATVTASNGTTKKYLVTIYREAQVAATAQQFSVLSTATANGINYSPVVYTPGHFGKAGANCMMAAAQQRAGSVAAGSAPVYVYCEQSDGSWSEVSALLFGSTPTINTNYPAVADFNGDGIDDVVFVEFWDGQMTQSGQTLAYMSNSQGIYTKTALDSAYGITAPSSAQNFAVNGAVYALASGDVNSDGNLDVITSTSIVYLGDGKGNFTRGIISQPSKFTIPWSSALVVCTGDLLGNGIQDIVIGGAQVGNDSTNFKVNRVLELDSNLNIVQEVDLPPPYWNVKYNAQDATNVQAC